MEMQAFIKNISKQYLDEASSSPQLLKDMAALEKYMAESYSERILIELIQNADDAGSKRICLFENNGHLFFANDGAPFSKEDIESISRSGASQKQRGLTIGYRGVGFKSACHLSDEILIHSSDVTFTFSKEICANLLKLTKEQVPTIRIPFLVESVEEEIKAEISNLKQAGFTTIFVFKNANLYQINLEIASVKDGYFLFLNHLEKINFILGETILDYVIRRQKDCITIHNGEQTSKTWYIFGEPKKSRVACQLNENGEMIPCSKEESVFHCYLPTLDKTGFSFKIQADFSTDPSRKHITYDEITDSALEDAAETIFSKIKQIAGEPNADATLLKLLKMQQGFQKGPQLLNKKLKSKLLTENWIRLKNGNVITPSEFKGLPKVFEKAEQLDLIGKSSFIQQYSPINSGIIDYVETLNIELVTLEEWIHVLSDSIFVQSCNDLLLGKCYGYIINEIYIKNTFGKLNLDISSCLVKQGSNVVNIKTNNGHSPDFIKGLSIVQTSAILWFDKLHNTTWQAQIQENKQTAEPKFFKKPLQNSVYKVEKRTTLTKWRSAEQQCLQYEEQLGNSAKDVSKQNVGYDIESISPTGDKRYIEVKSVSRRNAEITMTNNEYTAAHLHSNDYYLCVVYADEVGIQFTYIQNPLQHLRLEKRIKQWEWFCDEYTGEEIKITW